MASKPCQGVLLKSSDSLLLGAESEGDKIIRHFRGDMEEVALWSRGLSAQEISYLSKRE
jgi:hypothetical protein